MAEVKTHDTITYLSPTEFFDTYPKDKILTAGSYGEIYLSKKVYAVKKFIAGNSILDLAKELNIYASYVHPCILKPLSWTVRNNMAYLAMDKGEDIQTAFNEKKISLEEIVSDTLSAITFLNHQGIVHGDIKPNNIIYHNGLAKLIDMGLARKAHLSEDNKYYVTGLVHTSPYIDIEYVDDQENSINCEIYALAMTYLGIMTNTKPNFGDVSVRINPTNTGINWFFNQAARLQADRPSIQNLLKTAPPDLIVRHHIADMYHDPLFEQYSDCGENLSVVMNSAVKMLYTIDARAETLFLVLHLLHRVYQPLLDQYKGDTLDTYSYDITMGTIFLVTFILNDKSRGQMKKRAGYDHKTEEQLYDAVIDIMIMSYGIISTFSYWDYAASKEDLLPLLKDVISCKYNPTLIRKTTKGSNKCIKVKDFISSARIKKFSNFKTKDQMWQDKGIEAYPVEVGACSLEVGGSYQKLEKLWVSKDIDFKKEDLESYYAVTLHNRDQLPHVNLDVALKIYKAFLNRGKDLDDFVLDKICKVDWRTLGESVVSKRIFPF